ncbi:DUF1616 domain-containing protein [Chloroflexota bacterium]
MDWLSPIRELFGFALPVLAQVPIIRAIIGFVLVFFLPGFAWTLIFFKQIKVIERIGLSFGLSIAIVTLSILFSNMLFGIRITGFNSLVVICVITVLPLVIFYINKNISRRRDHA